MERYPDLLIEGCASGGRRIDLQTVQRSHTFWKSDDTARLNVMRFHETGGNALLPGALLNANLLAVSSQYAVHSLFGGPLGFGADLAKLPAKTVEMVRREVARYRGFRRLLNEDYYPLFPQRRDETGWIGWQFHDPAAGEGVAIVLRPADSAYRSAEIMLRGLDPAATYEVTRSTSTRKERLTGEALASQVVELAKPAFSVVLQYRRVK
jgi:alpha-galactosidase